MAAVAGSHRAGDYRAPAVIYVMGAGRSGSTILGVALGNCADIFYAGELEAWLRKSGAPNFGGTRRTQFWDAVLESVDATDLFGEQVWRCLEYSLAGLSLGNWRRRHRLRPRYRQVIEQLYRAIGSSSKATYIVDTSHYPLRARELQRLESIDLYLIYLVRDPVSVVASFSRKDTTNRSKSVAAANAYLCLTHLLSTIVFLRQRADRRLLLRNEDFIADPESMMRHILDWVDVSASLPDLTHLNTGIPFQGNRLLRTETLALRGAANSVPPRSCGSYLTKLLQTPWTVILSRLGPRAGAARSPEKDSHSRPFT
jgi:hypothetical protein